MKKLVPIALFCFVACAFAQQSQADIIQLFSFINESQEVPPTGSPATGFASITLDDQTNELTWELAWQDLSGAATGIHFHLGAPGNNGPVQVNIGSISGLNSPSNGSTTINATQAADLLAGLWYINIHSGQFPGGEIRGQVLQIPEPTAFGVMALAALGLGFRRRRS